MADLKQTYFNFGAFLPFPQLPAFLDYNFLIFFRNDDAHLKSVVTFINQLEDIDFFNNLDNVKAIYHYSVPNSKLAYPEPFVASASFMHTDLWFIHILTYQYWLWFIFIFLIVFFFITFVCILRWCNMRTRPRRETRGVSRSKCGDLITAIVPVSWATSIIVSESTDAIDYYDGFGTTELVVGIRAYQWGWEYYYPKDIDLNYNIKHNYSSFIGNSLKYDTTTDLNLRTNNLWKFYQNKMLDSVVTPAHLLLLPLDNFKLLNFLNFNDLGSNSIRESVSFKKIKMFSKTHHVDLISNSLNFINKYKNFDILFANDNMLSEAVYFGIKRQHDFLTASAFNNNHSTFFDLNSANKWLRFNTKFNHNFFETFKGTRFSNFFKIKSNSNLTYSSIRVNDLFHSSAPLFKLSKLSWFNSHPSIFQIINDDTETRKIYYPIFKIFNLPFKKLNLMNEAERPENLNSTDLSLFKINEFVDVFNNTSVSYKNYLPFSPDSVVPVSNKTIRSFLKISPYVSNFNFSLNSNSYDNYYTNLRSNTHSTNYSLYNWKASNWINLPVVNKLFTSKIFSDSPHPPVRSNAPFSDALDFDDCNNTFVEDVPTLFQGKEELMPSFLTSIYWNFYWSNTSIDWRFYNNINYQTRHHFFYLPLFSFYYDYDFRNWQNLEFLENAYWESFCSTYALDENLSLVDNFYEYEFLNKNSNSFFIENKDYEFKDKILTKPLFATPKKIGLFYSNYLCTDDFVSPSNLFLNYNFYVFPLSATQLVFEDSYENLKFLNYFFNTTAKLFFQYPNNLFSPLSTFAIFDAFRSNYDEFSWFFDNGYFSNLTNNLMFLIDYDESTKKIEFKKKDNIPHPLKTLSEMERFFNKYLVFNEPRFFAIETIPHIIETRLSKHFGMSLLPINFEHDFLNCKTLRFSNYINLRSSAKSSIVTYNAIQKIFRARFDEGRANTKLIDFSNSYVKQPFITAPRPQYEHLLGKNKENFFKINFYKNNFFNFFNFFYDCKTSLNFYFFDFPFLLASKSDASRYLWLDWFAKWGFYEVQPSSSSRYAIYGMPYFSKSFEFNTQIGECLNETETYFLRLSRARRNYLPNWAYTPYFYAKTNTWYKNNIMFELLDRSINSLIITENVLNAANWYWNDLFSSNSHSYAFLPSHSGINSYSRASWRPNFSVQSYYYSISNLIDILTKREYLYRQLLTSYNKIINLPLYFTNSPTNPLIADLKSAFLFSDSAACNNEYSREVYYNSLAFFNFNVLKPFLNSISADFAAIAIFDYFFFYFFNQQNDKISENTEKLYKNQYRPLRKGISNMIRLHATGAVAMPIETRLQILASSKDVIHSWAIPSAGIKIDCIPGYSSHKVTIFLVSGIFWGQCMEICGRYHHWMPIIVYFMKRDLFFLWCTHFVFLSGANNIWTINDRQFTDYTKPISFDKNTWLSELNL